MERFHLVLKYLFRLALPRSEPSVSRTYRLKRQSRARTNQKARAQVLPQFHFLFPVTSPPVSRPVPRSSRAAASVSFSHFAPLPISRIFALFGLARFQIAAAITPARIPEKQASRDRVFFSPPLFFWGGGVFFTFNRFHFS